MYLDAILTYSQLINMGFDEDISLKAAHIHPKNINKAINYITNNNENKKNDNDDANVNDINICKNNKNCKSIKNCLSIKYIIWILKMYKNDDLNDNNTHKLLQYDLNKIINSYHHILDNHLNEDNISRVK